MGLIQIVKPKHRRLNYWKLHRLWTLIQSTYGQFFRHFIFYFVLILFFSIDMVAMERERVNEEGEIISDDEDQLIPEGVDLNDFLWIFLAELKKRTGCSNYDGWTILDDTSISWSYKL